MYFIFSKILLFLITPINWIIILLLIAWFTKQNKLRKRTFIAGTVLLLLFSNPFLYNQFAKAWDIYPAVKPLPDSAHYSCAIVLGGFSGSIDNDTTGHFGPAADRFIQGLKLKTTGKVSHILVSSGNGSLNPGSFSEGVWAAGQLRQLNIPDSSILVEGKSRNTIENAKFSQAILKKNNLKPPYLLVTSTWHMRRSLMIFRKHGLDVIPMPCDIRAGGEAKLADLLPSFDTVSGWSLYIKEVIGYAVNYFMK